MNDPVESRTDKWRGSAKAGTQSDRIGSSPMKYEIPLPVYTAKRDYSVLADVSEHSMRVLEQLPDAERGGVIR